jgi:Rad3-related DNA helicase
VELSRIFEEFPAPSYRGAQEQALSDIRAAFEAGNDVVLVRAPTGSGKSLLARAVAGCGARPSEVGPADPVGAYYTTPQVSQLDDVAGDSLLEDLNIIRGKNNYSCILPGETDTPVNQAPCARERAFDCQVKHRCPYFSDRSIAANREIAAMTLAYFMQTAGSDVFGQRDVVVIDEAHGLGDWAEMYAAIELGPSTIPPWQDVRPEEIDGLENAAEYAEYLTTICDRGLDTLRGNAELSPEEVQRRDQLTKLRTDLNWFLDDYRDPDSVTTWVVDQHGDAGAPVTIKPVDPERYLKHTVWDRGKTFLLLSATILNREAFCAGVGLDPSNVGMVEMPHTFPLENRPLFDVTQGKMTYEHREETLPNIARILVRLMAHHPDEKGLVHCHSYAIQDRLEKLLREFGVGARIRSHDREDRDGQLAAWQRSSDPTVFLSVKMEEALDLEGDLCRWQLLCKAPYPNTNDSRVARRLEDGQWAWYYRTALRTVIQACGRVVRSPDDYGYTYLGDSSLLELFDRARTDMPEWFLAQVGAMERPDLPEFSPEAARTGGTTARSARPRDRAGGSQDGTDADDHPLSDVWGE